MNNVASHCLSTFCRNVLEKFDKWRIPRVGHTTVLNHFKFADQRLNVASSWPLVGHNQFNQYAINDSRHLLIYMAEFMGQIQFISSKEDEFIKQLQTRVCLLNNCIKLVVKCRVYCRRTTLAIRSVECCKCLL